MYNDNECTKEQNITKNFLDEPPSFLTFPDKPNHQTMACSLKYPIGDINALETPAVPVRPVVIDLQSFRMPRVIQLKKLIRNWKVVGRTAENLVEKNQPDESCQWH